MFLFLQGSLGGKCSKPCPIFELGSPSSAPRQVGKSLLLLGPYDVVSKHYSAIQPANRSTSVSVYKLNNMHIKQYLHCAVSH